MDDDHDRESPTIEQTQTQLPQHVHASADDQTSDQDKVDLRDTNDSDRVLQEWRRKREQRLNHHRVQQPHHQNRLEEEIVPDSSSTDESESLFVTAAKRRKLEQEALLQNHPGNPNHNFTSNRFRNRIGVGIKDLSESQSRDATTTVACPTTSRNHRTVTAAASEKDPSLPPTTTTTTTTTGSATPQISLLEQAEALHRNWTEEERLDASRKEEEARILREAKVQSHALQSAQEVAAGKVYTTPMPSTWTVPGAMIRQQGQGGEAIWNQIRTEWHILVEGGDIPPPMKRFEDMKFAPPILRALQSKGIQRPTPIQMQGMPVALAGRDMVGIAFTGSGKTLTFVLPLVMIALEEELRMPLLPREGPVGLILAPSRELARQTFEILQDFCNVLSTATTTTTTTTVIPHNHLSSETTGPYPTLTAQLMIGGESVRDQLEIVERRGLHTLVGTPGRIRDVLKRKALTLSICRYICLDEADRMLDLGFDEEVGEIMNYFPHQRQTLLFSATFPKKFQDFARQCLVQPVIVNVGRAGAANLDVIQEVEYVKEDAKIVYLLHCLQKTAPPVIIFTERKGTADDIHEYLLLKGVEAVSIHGGKDQEERNEAIKLFKEGKKDVLIATDIAAKGLDFPDIMHVINFDMPTEIENYVHRIGRTGRCGKTGVATTFINKTCDETTLLDLKGLLKEARQRIPPVLMMLDDPRDKNGGMGCSFCGGLGHTIVDCPKIDKDARRVAGSHRDVISGGGDW